MPANDAPSNGFWSTVVPVNFRVAGTSAGFAEEARFAGEEDVRAEAVGDVEACGVEAGGVEADGGKAAATVVSVASGAGAALGPLEHPAIAITRPVTTMTPRDRGEIPRRF